MSAITFNRIQCTVCGFHKWPSAFIGGHGRKGACRTCRTFATRIGTLRASITRTERRVEVLRKELASEEARFLAYQHGDTMAPKRRVAMQTPTHGQRRTYQSGCRCAVCVQAMRTYWRERRAAA